METGATNQRLLVSRNPRFLQFSVTDSSREQPQGIISLFESTQKAEQLADEVRFSRQFEKVHSVARDERSEENENSIENLL